MAFSPPASPSSFPKEVWTTALDQLSQRIRQYFVRPESHQRALAYLQGLMSDASRKNAWQVAETMGEATPYALQHLLDRAKWDCDGVRDELRTYIGEMLADSKGVVVIDETGFLKKGGKSVGVLRQYSGTAGRIENCQVPEEVTFTTKPKLAQRMLERTLDAGFPVAWVTGDTVYGSAQPLRSALEERLQAYALAVTCKEQVEVQGVRKRVDRLAHAQAREDWRILSAGAGSKGPRLFAWVRIELAAPETCGWQRWLLVRRNLEEGVKPAEMAYVLVFAPTGASLEEMVEAFGTRWTVEQCLEEGKKKWAWMSTKFVPGTDGSVTSRSQW